MTDKPDGVQGTSRSPKEWLQLGFVRLGVLPFLLIICLIVFSFMSDNFLTGRNLMNVLRTMPDLFWAMLEERISHQQEAFRGAVDYSKSMDYNVRMILSAVFGLLGDDALWGSLFMEFHAHAARNEQVRRRLGSMYEGWRQLIVDILSVSRETGRMRSDADLELMATVLVATVEGSIIQSRVAPEAIRLDEIVEPLTRTLSEWLTGEIST